jgi:hypothetical protein
MASQNLLFIVEKIGNSFVSNVAQPLDPRIPI